MNKKIFKKKKRSEKYNVLCVGTAHFYLQKTLVNQLCISL